MVEFERDVNMKVKLIPLTLDIQLKIGLKVVGKLINNQRDRYEGIISYITDNKNISIKRNDNQHGSGQNRDWRCLYNTETKTFGSSNDRGILYIYEEKVSSWKERLK
jgi:hypothetical protein